MGLAILGVVSALITFLTWFCQRKAAPTKDERKDDIENQYSDCIESVHRLRSLGKHDEAESMLARMRSNAAIARLSNDKQPANPSISPISGR